MLFSRRSFCRSLFFFLCFDFSCLCCTFCFCCSLCCRFLGRTLSAQKLLIRHNGLGRLGQGLDQRSAFHTHAVVVSVALTVLASSVSIISAPVIFCTVSIIISSVIVSGIAVLHPAILGIVHYNDTVFAFLCAFA